MITLDALWAMVALYAMSAVSAVILLVVGWWFSRFAQRFVLRVSARSARIDAMIGDFLASLVRYFVLVVVVIAVLQLFGIQTTSLIAVLGAASLAIGLALQGTLSNVAAGVMLLAFRPFKIGDAVEIAGRSGTVKSLSLVVTELVTAANVQVLLPNALVWGAAIVNKSTYPTTPHVEVTFPAPAGRAAENLARDLVALLRQDSRVLKTAEPTATISRIVDLSKAGAGVVEVTVSAQVEPGTADGVKADLLGKLNAGIAELSPATE